MKLKNLGFTLIELLVVIAIISILAAILFPVFAQAREKGRQTVCASNGKQIGLGILQYAEDYDEFLPQGNYSPPAGSGINGNVGWQYQIEPYVKAGAPAGSILASEANRGALPVYECPDFDTTYIGQDAGARPTSSYAASRFLFPGNAVWYDKTGSTPYFSVYTGKWYIAQTVNLAKITQPANQVAFAEAEGVRYNTDGNDTEQNDGQTGNSVPGYDITGASASQIAELWTANGAYALGRARHSGGGNYIFADGHVKWFKAPGTSYQYPASAAATVGDCTANPAAYAASNASDPCVDLTPIESQSGVVFSQAQYPNAVGFFLPDPNAQ